MNNKIITQVTLVMLGFMVLACRPAQKDPPFDWNHQRRDAQVKDMKIEADHSLSVIGAPELWKKTTGKAADGSRVRIGVVGTGVDYTIPDIRDSLAINLGELSENKRQNSFDDDNNGYIDDVFGYDFFSGDGMPYDWNGHDTFTAAIIASTARKNAKIIGVAPNAELLVARYMGSDARYTQTTGIDAAEALYYCTNNGAKVVYFNWPQGGFDEKGSFLVNWVIKDAAARNILIVIPAGNTANQDVPEFLKEAAQQKNVVVVAGLDEYGRIKSTSNSGKFLASVAAPTMGTRSYLPGGVESTDIQTTSVAAAYVAGAAALLSTLPGYGSVEKVRTALLSSAVTKKVPEPVDVLADGALYLGGL